MKRAIKQIAVCAVILVLICVVCRLATRDAFYAVIPLNEYGVSSPEDLVIEAENPDVLQEGEPVVRGDFIRVPVRPGSEGQSDLTVRNKQGEAIARYYLRVQRDHTVYDLAGGSFSGDWIVMIAFTVFCILVGVIMLWNFLTVRGSAFYSYTTIYFSGFSFFALLTGLVMLIVTIRRLADPVNYSMLDVYSAIRGASWNFMLLTSPLILIFAITMIISNVELLRHTTPRIQNILGILIALLLVGGELLGWYLNTRDFIGSEWEYRVDNTVRNVYSTIFVFFECMLAGSVICGVKATRFRPSPNKDFIIILGCKFRPDGTLYPLIRGRVDRAIEFWRKEKEKTGREAILIPSGGQGPDESMPEAVAMKRYLLEQGIPESAIRTEEKSANTQENMAFSRKIMEEIQPEGSAVFATTNYHVFRSGIWAAEAGVKAVGIGSRTKWWFWPNAFMRECIGLMLNKWKSEALLLLVLVGFFAMLSMTI